jgi:Mrp family chromosome partitioning ATPase
MGKQTTGAHEMDGIAELRTNVLVALQGTTNPVVAVTSPGADVTRRDAASALAASMTHTGRRVALIDADVTSRHDGTDVESRVSVIIAPAVTESNAALLVAADFQLSLAQTAAANDLAIVLCPPVLEVAETRAIAAACSGTVVVASERTSHRDQTVQAVDILRTAGAQILGIVLRRS